MASDGLTLRQRYVSAPALKRLRSVLPRMSDTEREALEAGTVWWDGELMSGNPNWEALLSTPEHQLTGDQRAFLDGPVDELCRMIDDWEICFTEREIPEKVWSFLKAHGFLGMIIPKTHGGLGFSATAHSAVIMKLAARGASAAVSVIVPNSLGPGELLLQYGTDAQKDHYLPRLADGREIPAFALTSEDAGSDAAAMRDHGVVCYGTWNGERTLGMRLNWSKRYISLGPICTVLGLAFKLSDPDHLLGKTEDLGITVALVPADADGVTIGRRHYPAMQVFPNGPNQGDDVFLPLEAIIGGRERIGQGWRMLVSALAAGRGISLPSLSTSGMKLSALSTGAYARIREQFNNPVARFEGVQEALARIAGETYRIDSGRRLTLSALDQGHKPAVISGMLKYHATEALRRVVDDAMDVHGGKGICDGPRNYLGNLYRAVPIGITVEGANILTRSLIIYGQGSIRCHPFILKEMAAAQNEDQHQAVKDFDAALFGHAGHILKTFGRAVARAWTGGVFSASPVDGPIGGYFKSVKRLSAALALVSEAAMLTMGGALKRKEMITGRLGDVLSELYFATAVLKRWQDDGRPEADLPLVHWAVRSGLNRAEDQLKAVLDNFPSRPLAWLLRLAIRPFGARFAAPSDRLARRVADLVSLPSATRDRLVAGIYVGGTETELGRLEAAFREMTALDEVRRRQRETGTISDADAKRLENAKALVREVVSVDDFTLDEIKGLGAKRAKKPRGGSRSAKADTRAA